MREKGKKIPAVTPEMEILLGSIGGGESREIPFAEILKKEIDWTKLKEIALYHKVLPLLYIQLKKLDESLVPQEEMAQIKSIYKHNALRNIRLAQVLHRVIELLSGDGIEVIAFKGPALAVQAYEDLSLRTFEDLDLLVHTGDFCKIYDVLTAAGYRSNFTLTQRMKRCWMRFRRDFQFSQDFIVIDFHHQISQGSKRISLKEKTWRNRCTVEILFRKAATLSPEHSLIALCVHGTKDRWNSLRIMADIGGLISRHPDLNWKTLVSDAEEIGCLRMVRVGLRLSRHICGVVLPEEILESAQKDRKAGKLASKYLHRLFSDEKAEIGKYYEIPAMLKSLDSFGFRITYLIHFIFTPTPLDWLAIPLPGILYPLYYLVRPLRLFFNLVSRLFRSGLGARQS
ncbi:MAG: nucleotidyltransferase family protein [Candidatus Aminicenantes bacterium]|nr:MAG: nucleotidyltransferase family protein [Candidatus Aminicenantes bacterium]